MRLLGRSWLPLKVSEKPCQGLMSKIRSALLWVVNALATAAISIFVGMAIVALALLTGVGIFIGLIRKN